MSCKSLSRGDSPTSAWKPRVLKNVFCKIIVRRLPSKSFLKLGGGIGRRLFKYERRFYFWGNSFSRGIMNHLSLVFDSVLFQIFLAHPTVPRVQRSPTSSEITGIYFFTHICQPSITNQCYLGTRVPCSAGNRISRGGPPTSA